MYNVILESMLSWSKQNDTRRTIQQFYIVVMVICLVVAGLFSMLDLHYANIITIAATCVAVTFIVNAASWAIIETFIRPRIHNERSSTSKQSSKKR